METSQDIQGAAGHPVQTDDVFHRTKRCSQILGFVGVVLGIALSGLFLLVGAVGLGIAGEVGWAVPLVIGGMGGVLFAVCVRWAWRLTSGPMVLVLTIDSQGIAWGTLGREKTLAIQEIHSFRWNVNIDGDLHFSVRCKDGRRRSVTYADMLLSRKDRPSLLAYLRQHHGDLLIEGKPFKRD